LKYLEELPWTAFEIHSFSNAHGMLMNVPFLHSEIEECLSTISFSKQELIDSGGGHGAIATRIERHLHVNGWTEYSFDISCFHDGQPYNFKTHAVDAVKKRVAIEVEWNSKDATFDRDLFVFRLLHERQLIDLGIIITRSTRLNNLFKGMVASGLSKDKFVSTTTHMDRLLPRLAAGSAGSCPVLAVAITDKVLRDDVKLYPVEFYEPAISKSTDSY
jgi:hypothetical protein